MNRRVWIVLGLLVSVGVLASVTWCCMDFMMKRHMAKGALWDVQTWPKVLNLTAEQRSKITPLEIGLKKETDALQSELAKNEIAFCQLMMSSGKPDTQAMNETLNKVGDLRKRKDALMLNHLVALRGVLNPEQQEKLFSTLMQDICIGCRHGTGDKTDHCGLCNLK